MMLEMDPAPALPGAQPRAGGRDKRPAWAATRVFWLLNGHDLTFSVDEAETVVVAAASGELDVLYLAKAIERHLPPA
jgi:death on curing protein